MVICEENSVSCVRLQSSLSKLLLLKYGVTQVFVTEGLH